MGEAANAPCASYRAGLGLCADGFPVKAYCTGDVGCVTCGAINEKHLPICLTEQAPRHLFDDSGKPRLAAHQHEGDQRG